MRYLSRIVLIESANVKYAEVNVDGNVHFIGTQGVGKSTLLRALLFFYNANQQKLGIPLGKKSFVDFYFPYQNSYIIYEVIRETGPFCILVFKSQGRVSFRFLDAAYDKNIFIDKDGRIQESWDKIKLTIGNDISYTRKIDRYEDYRNILYGNSMGLGAEFRKYCILESKQYQNIPRAIQHVFLNYKVESEFIKDTIIKSLNEEEIKIDLSNYSHHLKDFDTQLNDIKKWTDKTKSGEIIVRKQADTVITTYAAIQYNEREKIQLAGELLWQLEEIKKKQPDLLKKAEKEELKKSAIETKLSELDKKFQTKRDAITKDLHIVEGKLKEIKTKQEEYAAMNIESIIKRVVKKAELEGERDNLIKQKDLLEANFIDIKQKYEAQISQLINQLSAFENIQQTNINAANNGLFLQKENISKEYDKLYEEIRKHHQEELQIIRAMVEEKNKEAAAVHIKKAETKHKRFYEQEINEFQGDINTLTEKIRIAISENKQLQDEADTLRKQWEIDRERMVEISANQQAKYLEETNKLQDKINAIDTKIENSKDSLYGWLNAEYPAWEKTIGKVIDEDNILFKSGLTPTKVANTDGSFYGINIDLNEIEKPVYTIADYEKEKKGYVKQIDIIRKSVTDLGEQLITDQENLKRKYQPKINKGKETISVNAYSIEQCSKKLDEAKVALDEIKQKAVAEKEHALNLLQQEIEQISAAKIDAETTANEIELSIKKQLDNKRKEKDKKVEAEQQKVNDLIATIKATILERRTENTNRIMALRAAQEKEFDAKGADTATISALNKRIGELKSELTFIEANRDKVSDYNKDKRELFDKTDYLKSQKTSFENQLETEKGKHHLTKHKLQEEKELLEAELKKLSVLQKNIQDDLNEFESFKLTDCYKTIVALRDEVKDDYKTDKRCKLLIDELNEKYYSGIKRFTDLQESINKFNGNFSSQNIFKFKTNLIDKAEYFTFSEELKEFIEEDKISVYEKRVNELFADIIKQVGKETTELLSKEGEILSVINDVNKDFVRRNFAGVIKSIELRVVASENKVVHLLTEIKKFNDENIYDLGEANLFSNSEQTRESKNKKAIGLLTLLVKEISDYKHKDITLSDSFELEFKIIENDNDTNWVQNLSNVGSEGTDILVKAMINIMLLNVFKEGATKNKFKDFRLHCMMDEIGKLHPENVRGILKFANDRNIFLINSSPQSFDALAYRYTYKLAKDQNAVTLVNRLITNNRGN